MKLSLAYAGLAPVLAVAKELPTASEKAAAREALYTRTSDPIIENVYYLSLALLALKVQFHLLAKQGGNKQGNQFAAEALAYIAEAEKNNPDDFADQELLSILTAEERKTLRGVKAAFEHLTAKLPAQPDIFVDLIGLVHEQHRTFNVSYTTALSFEAFANQTLSGERKAVAIKVKSSGECAMYQAYVAQTSAVHSEARAVSHERPASPSVSGWWPSLGKLGNLFSSAAASA